jgi:dCMP deaminase
MRISRDTWAMELAVVTAKRATCLRRSVGCVLLNARGHVVATGYNGVASGQPHCNEARSVVYPDKPSDLVYPHACSAAHAPSGTDLEACQAVHAEQNALLQCKDVYTIQTCYTTTSPCVTCAKLLLNTSCQEIIFLDEYPQSAAKEMWLRAGRRWRQLKVG